MGHPYHREQPFVASPLMSSQMTLAAKQAPQKSVGDQLVDLLTRMNLRQKTFCVCYMQNGFDSVKAAAAAGYNRPTKKQADKLLTNKYVAEYIRLSGEQLSAVMQGSFEWKMNKLIRCVNKTIPDEDDAELNVSGGISAISEMNKMQGHYAPTRTINANLNLTEQREEVRGLVEQYKKDY
jgi:hypothetical protein